MGIETDKLFNAISHENDFEDTTEDAAEEDQLESLQVAAESTEAAMSLESLDQRYQEVRSVVNNFGLQGHSEVIKLNTSISVRRETIAQVTARLTALLAADIAALEKYTMSATTSVGEDMDNATDQAQSGKEQGNIDRGGKGQVDTAQQEEDQPVSPSVAENQRQLKLFKENSPKVGFLSGLAASEMIILEEGLDRVNKLISYKMGFPEDEVPGGHSSGEADCLGQQ